MSRATALINRVNAILNKFGPMDRTVYKRTISYTGTNDTLIGRYSGPPTYTDVVLNPQPYFERVGRIHLPGGKAMSMDMVAGGQQLLADDYEFVISPTAMALTELENPNIVLMLVNGSGAQEQLRLLDVERHAMQGIDVVYVAHYRSLNRPVGGQ